VPDLLPSSKTRIPGPKSRALARQLHRYESRNITHVSDRWPVFWQRASGANVWDVDGNRYVDLTAAFGVAGVGHNNARVVAALKAQAARLLHAMGDVHPNELKLKLARELVGLTFGRWSGGDSSNRRVRARGLQRLRRYLRRRMTNAPSNPATTSMIVDGSGMTFKVISPANAFTKKSTC